MKNILDMSLDEFSCHLKDLDDKVLNFKLHEEALKDKRKDPRSTRLYTNRKRGNFQGKGKWVHLTSHNPLHNTMHNSRESVIRQAISGLNELNNTVNTGKPRQNQMRIDR